MTTSPFRLSTQLSLLTGLLAASAACDLGAQHDEPANGVEDPGSGQRFDSTRGDMVDAAGLATGGAAASDAAASAVDARAAVPDADPGVDAGGCAAGRVTCGASCIEAIPPTVQALQERVFQRSCALASSCHTGNAPQAALTLGSVDAILDGVVGKPSVQVPSLSLLEPGRPDASYLIRKLRSTHTVGTAMPPPPSAPLCEAKIQALEAWVRAGAAR